MFWEERSKLLRAWVENNEDSGLVEAAVHYSKENEHELEGGKDLMTVADMIKAGFSTLLGQRRSLSNLKLFNDLLQFLEH